jgi:hypothetical protein
MSGDCGMAAVFVVLAESHGWEADAGRGADAVCPNCDGSGYATTRDGQALGTCTTCEEHGDV